MAYYVVTWNADGCGVKDWHAKCQSSIEAEVEKERLEGENPQVKFDVLEMLE